MDNIEAEIREERNRECVEGRYDSWLSDNISDLRKEFFDAQKKADKNSFPDYAEPKDVAEFYPDEFDEYCREEYSRSRE